MYRCIRQLILVAIANCFARKFNCRKLHFVNMGLGLGSVQWAFLHSTQMKIIFLHFFKEYLQMYLTYHFGGVASHFLRKLNC